MKINLNGMPLQLQENDFVTVTYHSCEDCGGHREFEVERDGNVIAHFGDYVYLANREPEIFGDVIKGRDPKSFQVIPFGPGPGDICVPPRDCHWCSARPGEEHTCGT
jgi:hypothetical protein